MPSVQCKKPGFKWLASYFACHRPTTILVVWLSQHYTTWWLQSSVSPNINSCRTTVWYRNIITNIIFIFAHTVCKINTDLCIVYADRQCSSRLFLIIIPAQTRISTFFYACHISRRFIQWSFSIFFPQTSKNFFLKLSNCIWAFWIISAQNFRLGKSLPHMYGSEDIPLPQNAPPHLVPLSGDLLRYLSLGADGLPLLTTLKPGSTLPPAEDEWTDHDYVELPSH